MMERVGQRAETFVEPKVAEVGITEQICRVVSIPFEMLGALCTGLFGSVTQGAVAGSASVAALAKVTLTSVTEHPTTKEPTKIRLEISNASKRRNATVTFERTGDAYFTSYMTGDRVQFGEVNLDDIIPFKLIYPAPAFVSPGRFGVIKGQLAMLRWECSRSERTTKGLEDFEKASEKAVERELARSKTAVSLFDDPSLFGDRLVYPLRAANVRFDTRLRDANGLVTAMGRLLQVIPIVVLVPLALIGIAFKVVHASLRGICRVIGLSDATVNAHYVGTLSLVATQFSEDDVEVKFQLSDLSETNKSVPITLRAHRDGIILPESAGLPGLHHGSLGFPSCLNPHRQWNAERYSYQNYSMMKAALADIRWNCRMSSGDLEALNRFEQAADKLANAYLSS